MIKEALEVQVTNFLERFKKIDDQDLYVISHFDTDGISSAAIITQALQRADIQFTLKIVKSLTEEAIHTLPTDKNLLFLDLASSNLHTIDLHTKKQIFVIDHHEVPGTVPERITIINPQLNGKEKISTAGLAFMVAKEMSEKNKDLAKLAVLGMIGDRMEKELDKYNSTIIQEGDILKKRGPLIYPSTRPLNRTLEYFSSPYINEVTGNPKGVLELLRECGLSPTNGSYPSLIELSEEETERLTTGILLRNPKMKSENFIGDLYLLKFFNKKEDARELSAMINACSRLGESNTALQVCLEIPQAKKRAETIHVKYRQEILTGLKYAKAPENVVEKKGLRIINFRNEIRDTIVGTIASIITSSSLYEEGTILVTMGYDEERIKVSSRIVGDEGRNLRELLSQVIEEVGGEVGGHKNAAGAVIAKEKENDFLKALERNTEIEVVRVAPQQA